MNDSTRGKLVKIALEELGREKAVSLLGRMKKEVEDEDVVYEIGQLYFLCKFAFPSIGGSYVKD
jgi:hypothetical protein